MTYNYKQFEEVGKNEIDDFKICRFLAEYNLEGGSKDKKR
jgi:hypothetical protein